MLRSGAHCGGDGDRGGGSGDGEEGCGRDEVRKEVVRLSALAGSRHDSAAGAAPLDSSAPGLASARAATLCTHRPSLPPPPTLSSTALTHACVARPPRWLPWYASCCLVLTCCPRLFSRRLYESTAPGSCMAFPHVCCGGSGGKAHSLAPGLVASAPHPSSLRLARLPCPPSKPASP